MIVEKTVHTILEDKGRGVCVCACFVLSLYILVEEDKVLECLKVFEDIRESLDVGGLITN